MMFYQWMQAVIIKASDVLDFEQRKQKYNSDFTIIIITTTIQILPNYFHSQ